MVISTFSFASLVLSAGLSLRSSDNRPLLSQISNGEKVHGRDRKEITT